MILPNRQREEELYAVGYQLIAGLDEVGRGAWAGPIVAAAVILSRDFQLAGVRDSKLLSPAQREKLYEQIIMQATAWSVASVSSRIIDQIGLQQANQRVLKNVYHKLRPRPDFLLVDGYSLGRLRVPHQKIVKGDRLVYSIAAASIVAKVWRDQLMRNYAKRFQSWGFGRHKGYGTRLHFKKISQYGFCPLHRRSFKIGLEFYSKVKHFDF